LGRVDGFELAVDIDLFQLINQDGVVRLTYRDRRSPKQDARSYGRDCIPPFARRFGPNDPQR